ncbi:hypothetical protein PHYSODRAFT_490747, partial [Phytophthora sojae]
MDFIVDVLHQVYELQGRARHQRRANREIYLRAMEMYTELQMSESVQNNGTLQRTAALEKFADSVRDFHSYLRAYNNKPRVVRLVKRSEMEERQQQINDEMGQLIQTMNFAATIASMNTDASVARANNKKRFP